MFKYSIFNPKSTTPVLPDELVGNYPIQVKKITRIWSEENEKELFSCSATSEKVQMMQLQMNSALPGKVQKLSLYDLLSMSTKKIKDFFADEDISIIKHLLPKFLTNVQDALQEEDTFGGALYCYRDKGNIRRFFFRLLNKDIKPEEIPDKLVDKNTLRLFFSKDQLAIIAELLPEFTKNIASVRQINSPTPKASNIEITLKKPITWHAHCFTDEFLGNRGLPAEDALRELQEHNEAIHENELSCGRISPDITKQQP
jgi:hypothetical protein